MEESQEFKERKNLIEMQKEADELRHKFKMEQLTFERETNRIFHEKALERERIKRAEERKMLVERLSMRGGRH